MELTHRKLVSNSSIDGGHLNDANFGFEDAANSVLPRLFVTFFAALSLLGTSLIISTFFAWKDFRSTSRRILVYICIADFLIAGSNLFGMWRGDAGEVLCKAQSFVTTTASLWSFFWTAFLAIFLYITVAKKKRNIAELCLKVFHVIAWGVPLALAGTALRLGVLGRPSYLFTSGWCWIDYQLSRWEKYLWILLIGKAWEVTAYVLCFVFYLKLRCHIRNEVFHHQEQFPSEESRNTALKAEKKLMLVPVIFVLVRIWGTIRFILYLFADVGQYYTWWDTGLLYLQGIGDSSQGFANFMLFCLFTEKFQTHLHDSSRSVVVKCQRLCCATAVKTASVRFRDDVEVMCSGQETCLIESGQKTYETC